MTLRRIFLIVLAVALLTACEAAKPDPTATPNAESIQAASTLFAQPTRATRPTPTITPVNDVELDLNRSTARMEQAVLAGDVDGYMAYVWDGDPVFWQDHLRWAQDWQEHRLRVFEIELYGIQALSADTAAARMTIRWSQASQADAGSAGGATASVLFYREEDTWRLGGERWKTVDLTGIRFYYFSDEIVDNEAQAAVVLEYLPSVYAAVTREFDFVPEHIAHIKMYESPVTLQNWTRLSIPVMDRWNEPGESIKLPLGSGNTPPQEANVAREYARFVLYEMAGSTHGNFPWWLEEGSAEYGGSLFRTLSRRNRVIRQVAARSTVTSGAEIPLFEWAALETQPGFLADERQAAADQAYTLVHYVTETYGPEARNAWIRAMAADQTAEEATQTHLGLSFAELDTQWRAWLSGQR